MQRTRRSFEAVALLAVVVGLWAGCGDDNSADSKEIHEIYVGQLHLDVDPATVGRNTIDTVRLEIKNTHYNLQMMTNRAKVCDVGGTVKSFGTNSAVFSTTDPMPTMCDSIHVLRGTFPTVFKGDSLFMTKTDVTLNTLFDFRLKRR